MAYISIHNSFLRAYKNYNTMEWSLELKEKYYFIVCRMKDWYAEVEVEHVTNAIKILVFSKQMRRY